MTKFKRGVLYAVASYAVWGVLPLFWKMLASVSPLQILSFRIICSLLFVAAILALEKNFSWLTHFRDAKKRKLIVSASLLITVNWGLFIWAINSGYTVQTSLGYYINPLISIMLGLIFLKEKLKPLQWAAFASAVLGVGILTAISGVFPYLSIALALTFGLYGLIKKQIAVGSLESLASETLASIPIALMLLLFPAPHFFHQPDTLNLFGNPSALIHSRFFTKILLVLAGPVTAIPLLLFASGAKLIPLSSLGFIQFISPTLTLLIGIFVFGEPFPIHHLIAFSFVWFGVILYSLSLLWGKPRPS